MDVLGVGGFLVLWGSGRGFCGVQGGSVGIWGGLESRGWGVKEGLRGCGEVKVGLRGFWEVLGSSGRSGEVLEGLG